MKAVMRREGVLYRIKWIGGGGGNRIAAGLKGIRPPSQCWGHYRL